MTDSSVISAFGSQPHIRGSPSDFIVFTKKIHLIGIYEIKTKPDLTHKS